MKRTSLIFAAVVGIAILLFALFSLPEPPQIHGSIHPKFETMEHGGSGVDRSGRLLWFGWGLGVLEIALFVSMVALGATTRRGLRGLGLPLIGAGLAFVAVWTALASSYRVYATGAATATFLGFPAPTAWVLFGIWPVPVLFVAFYALGFERWVATPRDLAEFDDRLAQLGREAEAEAEPGRD